MSMYCTPDFQGHAVHFLNRLTRASGDAAELALHLYHDPQLLRDSLAGIRIPDTFDRAAVSLAETDTGPYLVVSRTGKFITCLGKGMSLRGIHFISYSQLQAHICRSEDLRERLEAAKSLAGEAGGQTKLIERLRKSAEELSKEDLYALSALQPALQLHLFAWMFKAFTTARDLSRVLHRKKKVGPREEPALKLYWSYFYTAAHLAVLSGMNRAECLAAFLKQHLTDIVVLLSTMMRSGRPYMTVRLAWLIGKVGKVFLPECRRLLADPKVPEAWLLGLLGTLVIGIRHSKTAKQAQKAVIATFQSVENHPRDVLGWMVAWEKESLSLLGFSLNALLQPDEMYELNLGTVKELFKNVAREGGFPAPFAPKTVEEVRPELALAFAASLNDNFRPHPKLIVLMVMMTPWLARCEAEDLYLPRAFLQVIHTPWCADAARRLLDDERERLGKTLPFRVEKMPGRNDLCSCGSGKKYKKCCLKL